MNGPVNGRGEEGAIILARGVVTGPWDCLRVNCGYVFAKTVRYTVVDIFLQVISLLALYKEPGRCPPYRPNID